MLIVFPVSTCKYIFLQLFDQPCILKFISCFIRRLYKDNCMRDSVEIQLISFQRPIFFWSGLTGSNVLSRAQNAYFCTISESDFTRISFSIIESDKSLLFWC